MARVCWEEMTAADLVRAATEWGGVCLLPIGSLEKHAEHLPLGTDFIAAHRVAKAAAAIEPAVVFPPITLAVVSELRCHPGSVSLPSDLLLKTWELVCDEIARNGFRKIVIVNGHGGNRNLIPQLVMECLNRRKPYALYFHRREDDPALTKRLLETDYHSHACECETSVMMHLAPDLVRPEQIGVLDGRRQRDFDIGGAYSSVDWYSNHPTNYAGDARPASAEKGQLLFEARARHLAEVVAKIKRDQRVPELLAEFYDRADNPVG
jgi:creatinine amidohydrolase